MAKDFGVPRFFITFSITLAALEYNVAILNYSIVGRPLTKRYQRLRFTSSPPTTLPTPNSEENVTTPGARLQPEKISSTTQFSQ